jgi:hypothetical protein
VVTINPGGGLQTADILAGIDDPISIVGSPFGDVALVLSGYSNAMHILGYNQAAPVPWDYFSEVTYVGTKPQLPAGGVVIQKGMLKGMVLVAENLGVRQVQLAGEYMVTDLGLVKLGEDFESIVGAIGVTP